MPTSIEDLLARTSAALSVSAPGEESADAAAAALAHLGRALESLARAGLGARDTGRRELAAGELARACVIAGSQFPSPPHRVGELAAVAADGVATALPRLGGDERWAVVVELSQTVRAAADTAARFEPYAGVPALRRVGRLTEIVGQVAAADPPPVRARAVLDAPIPNEARAPTSPSEATAPLVTSVDRSMRAGQFTVAAALTACAGAEAVAERAAQLAEMFGGPAAPRAWTGVPDSWRTLQSTLRRVDDGSRYAVPVTTRVTDAALALHNTIEAETVDVGWSAQSATEMRYAANQLPVIAERVGAAMTAWARSGRLFAPARALPLSEDRVAELLRNRAVLGRPPDLVPAVLVARTAQQLSAALAVELDRSAGTVGNQPQPHLIRAHIASLAGAPSHRSTRDGSRPAPVLPLADLRASLELR